MINSDDTLFKKALAKGVIGDKSPMILCDIVCLLLLCDFTGTPRHPRPQAELPELLKKRYEN